MEKGKVIALHLCPGRRNPMTPVREAVALSDEGLQGDLHARTNSARQVLLMDMETLDSFDLEPGTVKENITVQGLGFSGIRRGQVFFVGDEVTLEVTGPCLPCERMDEIRPGLQEQLRGRRGVLAVVLNGGTIRVGDAIRVEPSREALLAEAAKQER